MALNNAGPLGQSTRALLSLQHRLTAGQQILHLKGEKLDRKLARNTRHLHLLRQLCLSSLYARTGRLSCTLHIGVLGPRRISYLPVK